MIPRFVTHHRLHTGKLNRTNLSASEIHGFAQSKHLSRIPGSSILCRLLLHGHCKQCKHSEGHRQFSCEHCMLMSTDGKDKWGKDLNWNAYQSIVVFVPAAPPDQLRDHSLKQRLVALDDRRHTLAAPLLTPTHSLQNLTPPLLPYAYP
jgi:hypothetical protein